jgi:hypothetical protein
VSERPPGELPDRKASRASTSSLSLNVKRFVRAIAFKSSDGEESVAEEEVGCAVGREQC